MFNLKHVTRLLFPILLIASASAEEPGAADQLAAFLDETVTLSAAFEQILLEVDGEPGEVSRGRFYLNRPGRFRWEYREPVEQLVVGDGTRLWMYDQDLEQVTVRALDEGLAGTPAMLLSGEGSLEESFRLGASYEEDGLSWIELMPLAEPAEFQGLRVGLADGLMRVMEVRDNLDQVSRIEFSDIARNTDLDEAMFRFEPPDGVDVIGQEGF
jgi:outer membrane lipoprotein carrier protein